MSRRRLSVAHRVFAAVALVALGAVLALRMLRPVAVQVSDPVLAGLNARHAHLQPFDAAALAKSEADRRAAAASLWTAAAAESLRADLRRAGFVLQALDSTGDHDLVVVRYLVTHPDYPFRDWEQLVRLIQRLAASPALTIDSLVLEAAGGGGARFAKVQFILAFGSAAPGS